MLSGLQRILGRVRVTSDALRISVLVAAGVTAGYFWRAAFEAVPAAVRPIVASPNQVALAPRPPVRITIPTPAKPAPARHVARRSSRVVATRPRLVVSRTPVPSVRPSPPQKPTPRPSTPTSPPPPPSTPSSPSAPPGGSTPAASTPTVAAPAAAPRGPAVGVAPPPPVVTQPTPQPPGSTGGGNGNGNGQSNGDEHGNGNGQGNGGDQGNQGDESRPGNGHGDKNHDHTGPKGHDD
jgi:hypothetical protein